MFVTRIEKSVNGRNIALIILLFSGILFLLADGSSGGDMENHMAFEMIDQVPQQKLDVLSQKKIFFGHQSVGNNIMEGLSELNADHQNIHLNIIRTKNIDDFNKPIFAHYAIGKNEDPLSKVEDFVNLMDSGLGSKVDIAFLKFCFVDIHSGTDIEDIFQRYKKSIADLKSRYPNMTIVHFTVPLLRTSKEGMVTKVKTFINGLVGKKKESFFSASHNVTRNKYNKMLVSYYSGKEPVFDLAKFESTNPSGKRESFSYQGHQYYSLVPEYTKDGGHLNEQGRKYVAQQLLIFLANL